MSLALYCCISCILFIYCLSCSVNFVLYSNRSYYSNDAYHTLGLSKGCASVLL
jgi:hypothetical protein